MTTSCLGGISNYDSTRANPQFVAGMEKIREVKGAVDIVSRTTQECKSLAVQLKCDQNTRFLTHHNHFKQALGRIGLYTFSCVKRDFKDCNRALNELQKLCNQGKNDLNHFEKNFVRQYSRISADQTATENSNINWEMSQLSTLGFNVGHKAKPLAEKAQKYVDVRMQFHRGHGTTVDLTGAVNQVERVWLSIRHRR